MMSANHSVFIENRLAAILGDQCSNCRGCYCLPPTNLIINAGQSKVFINLRPVATEKATILFGKPVATTKKVWI